eukprot:Skav205307  [mRNA]  locus=scaffold3444:51859:56230:+ [translate_table: standard]
MASLQKELCCGNDAYAALAPLLERVLERILRSEVLLVSSQEPETPKAKSPAHQVRTPVRTTAVQVSSAEAQKETTELRCQLEAARGEAERLHRDLLEVQQLEAELQEAKAAGRQLRAKPSGEVCQSKSASMEFQEAETWSEVKQLLDQAERPQSKVSLSCSGGLTKMETPMPARGSQYTGIGLAVDKAGWVRSQVRRMRDDER